MRRLDLARLVAARLEPGHVVICGMGAVTFEWRETGATAPTYYAADAMGLSPGLALGFALAEPDRSVVLLEGDGDLIMNLGVLLTIAAAAPPNLRIVVLNNGRYETGGGQPIPGADLLRLDAMADAAGFPWARECGLDMASDEVGSELDELFAATSPALLAVAVDAQAPAYPGPAGPSGVEERVVFQQQLKAAARPGR